jgi:hypothetical protein
VQGGTSVSGAVTLVVLAFLAFVASGFVIRESPAFTPATDGAHFRADFIFPGAALWLAYWAIFCSSAYLRPRTVWRQLELVITALVLVCISFWRELSHTWKFLSLLAAFAVLVFVGFWRLERKEI